MANFRKFIKIKAWLNAFLHENELIKTNQTCWTYKTLYGGYYFSWNRKTWRREVHFFLLYYDCDFGGNLWGQLLIRQVHGYVRYMLDNATDRHRWHTQREREMCISLCITILGSKNSPSCQISTISSWSIWNSQSPANPKPNFSPNRTALEGRKTSLYVTHNVYWRMWNLWLLLGVQSFCCLVVHAKEIVVHSNLGIAVSFLSAMFHWKRCQFLAFSHNSCPRLHSPVTNPFQNPNPLFHTPTMKLTARILPVPVTCWQIGNETQLQIGPKAPG